MLPPLKPIPIKERLSVLFVERCQLDVLDGAFVALDQYGVRKHIPVGGVVCLMLEPGVRVSHAACALAARVGTLLVWIGEGGVRVYSSGQPGGARADRLLYQAKLALDDDARLKIVRTMYRYRFGEEPPQRRSVEQLRGIEGARVRATYQLLARQFGVDWKARNYDYTDWDAADIPNRCLSAATSCLYGVTEAAVLAAGYAPAIGFIHTGKALSFVYDIADLYKFDTVVPIAFAVAAKPGRCVRRKLLTTPARAYLGTGGAGHRRRQRGHGLAQQSDRVRFRLPYPWRKPAHACRNGRYQAGILFADRGKRRFLAVVEDYRSLTK